jgi:hypothetical protein
VVEFRTGIPDGIPDAVRDGRDVIAATVEQQYVQVAARKQFLSAVPADRHQGDAGLGAEELR